jgi:hypothetical protein
MKKVILGLLTLTAFGAFVGTAYAGENESGSQPPTQPTGASAAGNNAVIQSVDMKTDQMGTNNSSSIRGSVRNSVRGGNAQGSNGVVQEGRVEVIQTGADNAADSEFELRNRINTRPGDKKHSAGQ